MARRSLIQIGMRFGRLTVIGPAEPSPSGQPRLECRCDCGKITRSHAADLPRGKVKSCGCLNREKSAQRAAQLKYRHGDAVHNDRSPLYRCWRNMKERCLNPKNTAFECYGKRGITMAPAWIDDYPAFRRYIEQHLGPRPSPKYSIDRRDNDGIYEPGNLRWATRSQQNQNQRRSKLTKTLNALMWDETL